VRRGGETGPIVGVNWGSSNFRAYRIGADGAAIDEYAQPKGIVGLDRDGMAAIMDELVERWGGNEPIYASGMIGSNVGWCEVPYADAPAGRDSLAGAAVEARIGKAKVRIVPGVTCRRSFDDMPDILRGEEIELLGVAALVPAGSVVGLPGTHTKWARLDDGRIGEFITSMSGEIFDRLTSKGLLASVVEGEAHDGPAFREGVHFGSDGRLGLGTLLFGARARVIRGEVGKRDAASYIRGLLIGSEVSDALRVYPSLSDAPVVLVGTGHLSRLYARALASKGVKTTLVDSRDACLKGFRALHEAANV
jgi:2-dehydro-3-deoxygalactonokinase